jgi:prolipoprotein diacylglyceryltransferase
MDSLHIRLSLFFFLSLLFLIFWLSQIGNADTTLHICTRWICDGRYVNVAQWLDGIWHSVLFTHMFLRFANAMNPILFTNLSKNAMK